MHKTLLLLGTNVGNKEENLLDARRMIGKDIGRIEMLSSMYETAAWGQEDQAAYLNQVLVVSTTKTAIELMRQILKIESDMGRVRLEKWAPRVIDIDILFFDNLVLHETGLHIPHPHLHERKFTLAPLAELIPHYIHPEIGKSVGQLLREVNDHLEVRRVSSERENEN